ncbi:MAG TPA: hypothetical protein VEJ46_07425 [Candidatus Acidoferrum sp.]|nr:hypothetical protein [Candidatus Acidoferrum sp.]
MKTRTRWSAAPGILRGLRKDPLSSDHALWNSWEKGVKPNQVFGALTHSKQRAAVQKGCQFFTTYFLRYSGFAFLISALLALAAPTVSAQSSTLPKKPTPPHIVRPAPKPVIAPDLAERFAKFKPIHIAFDSSTLTDKEQKMVAKLVDAAGLLDCIYWRQSDPDGLKLYLSLADSKKPQDQMLREYLKINGGRYDLIDDNKPFVGTAPAPPGRGFFPWDLTRAEFDSYVSAHPDQKAALYGPQTIVLRPLIENGPPPANANELEAMPYHTAFREFLVPAARDLRQAAELSDDPAFVKFLQLRAHALLTDNYWDSDIAWLDLKNPKFDIIFAPYETYLDGLLGVKTSYGASVMIRNDAESKKLEMFQKYVPQLQESLPLAAADLPSKRGKQSPMEVVDAIYRSGDLLHGYQAVADNLPNDPRIHEQKGSKKIFWKNFLDARVNFIILPIAQRLMPEDQAKRVTGEGLLDFIILHEISHGLGPAYARTAAGKTDIREAIGPQYSALEEAKADITGMMCVKWLVDHGAIPKEKLNDIYASFLGETFRTIRFGIAEAHGQGAMMEFSYLTEQGAIRRDPSTGLYSADFDRMPGAIASLAKELLEQEATGDRARTESWFKKYAVMPSELSAALAKGSDIPVDVDPDFDFHPPLR